MGDRQQQAAGADAVDRAPEGGFTRSAAPHWAVIGIFLLLAVAAIAQARDFLMPVVLAFLLALVFENGGEKVGHGSGGMSPLRAA